MRIARWAFAVLLATPMVAPLWARVARAQDQNDSLAAAARRAREQKKDQPKAGKVYDNDSIPATGRVNVVGQDSSGNASAAAAQTAQVAEEKPAPSAQEVANINADLDAAKQLLRNLKADLDVAQRKYALDQQTYLSNPNQSKDKAGAAALAGEKSDIDAKAAAVADAEKALAAAQAEADQANKEAAAAQEKAKAKQEAARSAAQQPAPQAPPAHPPDYNQEAGPRN